MKLIKTTYIILFISPCIFMIVFFLASYFLVKTYVKIKYQNQNFYFSVINHTDYDFYITINVNNKETSIKNCRIKRKCFENTEIKLNLRDYSNFTVNIQIREKYGANLIIDDTLSRSSGELPTAGRDCFLKAVDIILNEDGIIEALYSNDTFPYGMPGNYYYSTHWQKRKTDRHIKFEEGRQTQ